MSIFYQTVMCRYVLSSCEFLQTKYQLTSRLNCSKEKKECLHNKNSQCAEMQKKEFFLMNFGFLVKNFKKVYFNFWPVRLSFWWDGSIVSFWTQNLGGLVGLSQSRVEIRRFRKFYFCHIFGIWKHYI